jgi:hypothetical protein
MAKFDKRQERMKERIDARAAELARKKWDVEWKEPVKPVAPPVKLASSEIDKLMKLIAKTPPELAIGTVDWSKVFKEKFEPPPGSNKPRSPNYYGELHGWADVLKHSGRTSFPKEEPDVVVADAALQGREYDFEGFVVYRQDTDEGELVYVYHAKHWCYCSECARTMQWSHRVFAGGEYAADYIERELPFENPLSRKLYMDRVLAELRTPKAPPAWTPNVWLDEQTGRWTSSFPDRETWEAEISIKLRGLDLSDLASKLTETLAK